MNTRVDGVRIRILLRSCKSRIARLLHAESWSTLQGNDSDKAFQRRIYESLSAMPDPRDHLPQDVIGYLCAYKVREFLNSQAHEASEEEILESVKRYLTDEKQFLLTLYGFFTHKPV